MSLQFLFEGLRVENVAVRVHGDDDDDDDAGDVCATMVCVAVSECLPRRAPCYRYRANVSEKSSHPTW